MINVSSKELEIIQDILFNEPYQFAVFGSRSNGTHHQYSDLDLVIYSQEPLPMLYLDSLLEKFSDSNLPYTVDIVDYYRIDNTFQKIVDNTKKDLFG